MRLKKLTILPLIPLLAGVCTKNPTSSLTGTLTGTVKLEGQRDHSGVTVALYELAELDTSIVRLNQEYPNVAFPIFQVTEFDHRLAGAGFLCSGKGTDSFTRKDRRRSY
jgi:hypothetical protein